MGLEDLKLNFFETKYTPETSTNNEGGANTDDYAKKLISIFDANVRQIKLNFTKTLHFPSYLL